MPQGNPYDWAEQVTYIRRPLDVALRQLDAMERENGILLARVLVYQRTVKDMQDEIDRLMEIKGGGINDG